MPQFSAAMQIRLSKGNATKLNTLRKLYRQTCDEYDLSNTQQCNLLLSGRLTLAITAAEKELNHARRRSKPKRAV